MNPVPDPTETVLRDNVRLYVDFRDASFSQIHDYIRQLKGLVRNVAAFSYLMIDPRERSEVLKAIGDLNWRTTSIWIWRPLIAWTNSTST